MGFHARLVWLVALLPVLLPAGVTLQLGSVEPGSGCGESCCCAPVEEEPSCCTAEEPEPRFVLVPACGCGGERGPLVLDLTRLVWFDLSAPLPVADVDEEGALGAKPSSRPVSHTPEPEPHPPRRS